MDRAAVRLTPAVLFTAVTVLEDVFCLDREVGTSFFPESCGRRKDARFGALFFDRFSLFLGGAADATAAACFCCCIDGGAFDESEGYSSSFDDCLLATSVLGFSPVAAARL